MKRFLLSASLFGAASAAHAQLLPTPGQKNPDWVLVKTEAPPSSGNESVIQVRPDPMPNAMRRSLFSMGNHHYHWNDQKQLAYDWLSQGSSVAPHELVNVRELNKGVTHVYRRAAPRRAD